MISLQWTTRATFSGPSSSKCRRPRWVIFANAALPTRGAPKVTRLPNRSRQSLRSCRSVRAAANSVANAPVDTAWYIEASLQELHSSTAHPPKNVAGWQNQILDDQESVPAQVHSDQSLCSSCSACCLWEAVRHYGPLKLLGTSLQPRPSSQPNSSSSSLC